ncbi:MAG TPA: hypothetical protein VKW06_18050 [Candidatus Angelobacter sp.]|nr:hypothetical protein [Candidatus Angelobacter sp.]
MLENIRRLLQALRNEREFFLAGGYGLKFRGKWRPTLLIRDSPLCTDNSNAGALSPCAECPLLLLVPHHKRNDTIPCHHIALDAQGLTIAQIYETGSQQELDRRYLSWLGAVIEGLEHQREIA